MTAIAIDALEPEPVDRPDADGTAAKRRAVIRTVLEVGTPLVAFYGLRAIGHSEYFALLAATIVAGRVPIAAIGGITLDNVVVKPTINRIVTGVSIDHIVAS